MLHIGKNTKDYILEAFVTKSSGVYVPYTCIDAYFKLPGVKVTKKDVYDFCYLHGSVDDLLKGKICVVRDLLLYPVSTGKAWWIDDRLTYYYADHRKGCINKYVLHLADEKGVLIVLGLTSHSNVKVVYKP